MMTSGLARVLLARGIIRQGTVVDAYSNVRGLSCVCNSNVLSSFLIIRARLLNKTEVVFDTLGAGQVAQLIRAADVINLDGMPVERVALAQNLHVDGTPLASKSRRGRRKKAVEEAIAA